MLAGMLEVSDGRREELCDVLMAWRIFFGAESENGENGLGGQAWEQFDGGALSLSLPSSSHSGAARWI